MSPLTTLSPQDLRASDRLASWRQRVADNAAQIVGDWCDMRQIRRSITTAAERHARTSVAQGCSGASAVEDAKCFAALLLRMRKGVAR